LGGLDIKAGESRKEAQHPEVWKDRRLSLSVKKNRGVAQPGGLRAGGPCHEDGVGGALTGPLIRRCEKVKERDFPVLKGLKGRWATITM